MKQLTGIEVQECTASTISTAISKPCDGAHASANLDASQPTTLLFTLKEVSGYETNAKGELVISFTDKSTLTIPNFKELAAAGYTAKLSDGTIIEFDNLDGNMPFHGEPEKIVLDYSPEDIKSVREIDGGRATRGRLRSRQAH